MNEKNYTENKTACASVDYEAKYCMLLEKMKNQEERFKIEMEKKDNVLKVATDDKIRLGAELDGIKYVMEKIFGRNENI